MIPWSNTFWPGLTPFGPPMWQAETDTELILSASATTAVGQKALALAKRRYSTVSPVWILSCFLRLPKSLNFLSHLEQLNGLSPVWVLSWVFKVAICVNFLSHFEQLKGFSPVWILSWVFKLWEWLKFLSHLEQPNGFSAVWILLCVLTG